MNTEELIEKIKDPEFDCNEARKLISERLESLLKYSKNLEHSEAYSQIARGKTIMYGIPEKLLCEKCFALVPYTLRRQLFADDNVNGVDITYERFYGTCDKCGSEIYIPGFDDYNDAARWKVYMDTVNSNNED